MNIINCYNGVSKPFWNIKNINKETIDILNSMESYHITHIYWESNTVVDTIANVVVRCEEKMTWQGGNGLPMNVISSIDCDVINGKEGTIISKNGHIQK